MKRLALLLLISTPLYSQEYVSLTDHKVYDIEVIVFAYETMLPSPENYTNSSEIDNSESKQLELKLEETPYLNIPKTIESDDLTLPIDGETETNIEALVWFEHDESQYKMINLWEKLSKTENIRPLMHKSWRQPETPFKQPVYVAIDSNEPSSDETVSTEEFIDTDENFDRPDSDNELTLYQLENPLKEDYLVRGQMALSKGRYLHFGNQLNLYRNYQKLEETRNMVFGLTQRKQIKPDEIQYFDNPWFGVIVKVTEYSGEANLENDTNEGKTNE